MQKRKASPALSTDDGESDGDSLMDQDDLSHMTTIESVVNEIGLSHPIVYDVHNLCNYVREGKLMAFTIPVLKKICPFFDLQFKSKDTKVVLISKVKLMTTECRCSTKD